MDQTSFGQIEIYNSLFQNAIPSINTPSFCLNNKQSYIAIFKRKRIPIMIGSVLHVHKNDNPLGINGYFIIDGICKTISMMYVFEKTLFTKDRAYLSCGSRVSILSFGKYIISKNGVSKTWYLPMNYKDIAYFSKDTKHLITHLDIIVRNTKLLSTDVSQNDALILACMFDEFLGITNDYVHIKRIITPGELIHDSYTFKKDIIKCFRTNTWNVKNIYNVNNVSEDMKHYSLMGDIEAIRRITYPANREVMRMSDREVSDYNKYKICPVQTSDGTLCGTILYLSMGATVSQKGSYIVIPGDKYFLFENGLYIGKCKGVHTIDCDIYTFNRCLCIYSNHGRLFGGQNLVSYVVDSIPYRKHNPPIRSMFASSMIKQAITHDEKLINGWFNDVNYLVYGEQPNIGKQYPVPCGHNVIVAIMPYFGYNVEDALVISNNTSNLYTSKKIMIHSSKLNTEYDFIIDKKVTIGTSVERGDILFTAYHPSEIVTLEEMRSTIDGTVTDILESKYCYSVKVVREKNLEVGDKISNRHGQKGVISKILNNKDIPEYYCEGEWRKIDVIMNPHTFPTRKTIGQLLEMGNNLFQVRINGKILKSKIIVGSCFYMALRQQVIDKYQYRNIGKIDTITRQAITGKSRKGGLRFGQMEKDILLASGAISTLKEIYSIDKIKISTCNICGIISNHYTSACPHKRIIVDAHYYLLVCLVSLRSNGHDILYFYDKQEYSIVDYDISINEEVHSVNDLYFGVSNILEMKYYNVNDNIHIPILPSILRTNHLEILYRRMFTYNKYKNIFKELKQILATKNGFYHVLVEGHRVNHCVRSVIVPAPHLPVDTIELPFGCNIGKHYGLLNRQPSLNEGSMMSVSFVVGENKTIGIHPSLCKSFNADFDGDEMCVYGITNPCTELPIVDIPTQDYEYSMSINDFTYRGLTATKQDILYMIDNKVKGTEIDYEHIYGKIGKVIVGGNVVGYIQGNYIEGLSEDEWYIQSKAAREGASSIGINTPFIGELNSKCNKACI